MNQYRHSKSSLFLMEIILNILFFSILATFCVQIFFKGYQLSKSTEKLHQAVTACTSIAEICQSTDSPEETLSSIYPESMSLNETILIYYNKDFLACGKQNAVYRATVDFLPDQLATIHIPFLDTSTAETLYELSASCYQPIYANCDDSQTFFEKAADLIPELKTEDTLTAGSPTIVGNCPTCTFQVTINDVQNLYVTLELLYPEHPGDEFYKVTQWQTVTNNEPVIDDDSLHLYQGN